MRLKLKVRDSSRRLLQNNCATVSVPAAGQLCHDALLAQLRSRLRPSPAVIIPFVFRAFLPFSSFGTIRHLYCTEAGSRF